MPNEPDARAWSPEQAATLRGIAECTHCADCGLRIARQADWDSEDPIIEPLCWSEGASCSYGWDLHPESPLRRQLLDLILSALAEIERLGGGR
jgi:hypothetical protein